MIDLKLSKSSISGQIFDFFDNFNLKHFVCLSKDSHEISKSLIMKISFCEIIVNARFKYLLKQSDSCSKLRIYILPFFCPHSFIYEHKIALIKNTEVLFKSS